MNKLALTLMALLLLASCSSTDKKEEALADLKDEEVKEFEDLLDEGEKEEMAMDSGESTEEDDFAALLSEDEKKEIAPKKAVAVAPVAKTNPTPKPKKKAQLVKQKKIAKKSAPKRAPASLLDVKRYLNVDLTPTPERFVYWAKKANFETLRYMMNSGIDVNAQNKSGKTALMSAAEAKREKVVTFLLNKGADTSISDNRGRSALDYAKKSKNKSIIEAIENQ